MFSYSEIGERHCKPSWNHRSSLIKHYLVGTFPVRQEVTAIVDQYDELSLNGCLGVGPIDIQYYEFMSRKASSR